jgi:tetratricopeptide (TPR) repeat protein
MIGSELMLEHLHPNIGGYFLMAKTFCRAIAQKALIAGAPEWQWSRDKTDAEYMELSTVSEFDSLLGKIKIDMLTHKWPFQTGNIHYEFVPANLVERIVYKYILKAIAWSTARYELAGYYAEIKDYARARRECRAVSKVVPQSYEPLLRVADYYRMEGKRDEAQAAYRTCILAEDNPFARMKLAIILLEEENAKEASEEIESAFALAHRWRNKFTPKAAASGRYLLGVAYAKLGKGQLARENLQRAIAIQPDYRDAQDLLKQLER